MRVGMVENEGYGGAMGERGGGWRAVGEARKEKYRFFRFLGVGGG
jgi:hypothetical protein